MSCEHHLVWGWGNSMQIAMTQM